MKTKCCECSPRAAGHRSAFTLIELLVVVAIIAILVGMVVGISGYASRKSAIAKALSDMERIKSALEEYRLTKGGYLATTITVANATYTTYTNTLSKIDDQLKFMDPWGRPYQYLPIPAAGSKTILTYRMWSQGASTTSGDDDVDSSSGVY